MKEIKRRIEWLYILYFASVFVLGALFFMDARTSNAGQRFDMNFFSADSWTVIREDGTTEDIVLPCKLSSVDRKEKIIIESTLPDQVAENMWMYYYTASNNRVYINGELRKEYDRDSNGTIGGTVGDVSLFCKITPNDAGKTVRIEFDDELIKTDYISSIYIGDTIAMMAQILNKYTIQTIIAFLLMVASILITIIDFIAAIIGGRKSALAHLSAGAVFATCWIVFSARVVPLVTSTSYISGTVAIISLMLIPFPVIIYINRMQKGRLINLHLTAVVLTMVLFPVATLTHFFGIISFIVFKPVIYIVMIAVVLIELFAILLDLRNGHASEYRFIVVGLGIAISAAIIESVINGLYIVESSGLFLELGLAGVLLTGFFQQISENHEAERTREQALAANESKSSFLASMSHEIRTPINSIIGMNEMILRENRNPQIREYATQVDRSGKMLLSLINDVLDFSKIEAGKMTILDVPYQTSLMLNDLVQLLNERTIAKSLLSRFEIAEDIPSELSGDEIHIKQIVVNLISNGVKYTKEGCVSLSASCERTKNAGEIMLIFKIKDDGIGIKKENLETLFDRFTRLDEQKNRTIEGTGLGLSIVKRLVDEMHGTISVESEYGKGSTFTVSIPQKISVDEPIGDIRMAIQKSSEASTEYIEKFHAPKARILIVDDNLVNLKVACELLKETKMQIDTVTGGRECIHKCRDTRYDLILMDHRMPDPDGVETLHLLRDDFAGVNYDTKVIVLTANVFAGIREKYLADGFVDYLSKPIDSELLEKCILRHLDPSLIEEVDPDAREEEENEDKEAQEEKCRKNDICKTQRLDSARTDSILKAAIDDNIPQYILAENRKISKDGENKPDVEKAAAEKPDEERNDAVSRDADKPALDTQEPAEPAADTQESAEPAADTQKSDEPAGDTQKPASNVEEKLKYATSASKELAERLRSIPGMDVDQTIERYGSKGDFLKVLFATIISDGRAKAEQMRKHLEAKDYKSFGIEAHATKTSMNTIFATEMAERAKAHEFACKEDRFEFVEEDGAAFLDDYERFLDMIDEVVKG